MRIEYLTKPQCEPSVAMHPRVVEAVGAEGFDVVDLTRLPSGDVRRRYDTPTLLVDGADLFGLVPRTDLAAPPS